MATEAIRALVSYQYETVLDGLDERRRPDARADGSFFDNAGETRGRQGVAIRDMLALWRIGLEKMKSAACTLMPERCWISMMGLMSLGCVRAAQYG